MATTPFKEVGYLNQARERYTEQFKNKDVFDRYVQLLLSTKQEIQLTLKDLIQKRTLDSAEGVQLDIIGEIVGQPRELIEANLLDYFGMLDAFGAGSMGELGDSNVGELFWELGRPTGGNLSLDDNSYRLFIRAKIIKNITTSTPEEYIYLVNFLFGTSVVFLTENIAEFTVFFGRQLTKLEVALLGYVSDSQGYETRLLPKTVGVRINYGQFRQNDYFGFQGTPGVKGFGGISDTVTGYGLSYGFSYGEGGFSQNIECINSLVLDGRVRLDGSTYLNGGRVCFSANGGYFAELLRIA